jgi:hypothetical protein
MILTRQPALTSRMPPQFFQSHDHDFGNARHAGMAPMPLCIG